MSMPLRYDSRTHRGIVLLPVPSSQSNRTNNSTSNPFQRLEEPFRKPQSPCSACSTCFAFARAEALGPLRRIYTHFKKTPQRVPDLFEEAGLGPTSHDQGTL